MSNAREETPQRFLTPRTARWAALAWMALIFWFSSQPQLPSAPGWWDLLLKKTAHVSVYAVLGWLYARGWGAGWRPWAAAVLYAISDEVHQAFVPGRHPWAVDVLLDSLGAALGIRWGDKVWWEVIRRIPMRSRFRDPVE